MNHHPLRRVDHLRPVARSPFATPVVAVIAAVILLAASCGRATSGMPAPAPVETPASPETVADPTVHPAPSSSAPRGLRAGDLVFQTSRSAQSDAVQAATRSPLSHMGLVLPSSGDLVVYEAVGPVKTTPTAAWIARGKDQKVLVKRLRRGLSTDEIRKLVREVESLKGRPYDPAFGWSDDRIYCSELVWKAFHRALGLDLSPLARLGDFDLSSPVVQGKLRERYGASPPLDEPVIAPAALAESPLLETVQGD